MKLERRYKNSNSCTDCQREKRVNIQSLFEELRQEGFVRVKVDGEIYNLDEDEIELEKQKKHDICCC